MLTLSTGFMPHDCSKKCSRGNLGGFQPSQVIGIQRRRCGEMADTGDLKSPGQRWPCGFESRHRHQPSLPNREHRPMPSSRLTAQRVLAPPGEGCRAVVPSPERRRANSLSLARTQAWARPMRPTPADSTNEHPERNRSRGRSNTPCHRTPSPMRQSGRRYRDSRPDPPRRAVGETGRPSGP